MRRVKRALLAEFLSPRVGAVTEIGRTSLQENAWPANAPSDHGSRQPLLALQNLRFLAAATVLVHHAGFDSDTIATRFGKAPFALDRWFDWAFGIHLFFVLSGFIMVYAERDFGRADSSRRFLVRRIFRVVPLYWALTTLLLVGALVAPNVLNNPVGGWLPVLGSYLFLPIPRSASEPHPVLGQGWTLNYEMFFYAAFALAMVSPRRVGLIALAAAFCFLVLAGALAHPQSLVLQTWTDPLLFEFVFGVGVAVLYDHGVRLDAAVSTMLTSVGLLTAISFGPLFGLNAAIPGWIGQGGPAALILAGLTLGPPWPAIPVVLFGSGLGDASYSLYLSHPFAIRALRQIWLRWGQHLPLTVYLFLSCATAILLSVGLYRLCERPVTRWLRRRFSPRRDYRPGGSKVDLPDASLARRQAGQM